MVSLWYRNGGTCQLEPYQRRLYLRGPLPRSRSRPRRWLEGCGTTSSNRHEHGSVRDPSSLHSCDGRAEGLIGRGCKADKATRLLGASTPGLGLFHVKLRMSQRRGSDSFWRSQYYPRPPTDHWARGLFPPIMNVITAKKREKKKEKGKE